MNKFIDRMDIKFLGASLAGVRTSEQERMDILANGIKSSHQNMYGLLRAVIGNPCKSIDHATTGRELLSDVQSEDEQLDTTKILAQRIIPEHGLLSMKDLNHHSRNQSSPNTDCTGKATSQRERYHRMQSGKITESRSSIDHDVGLNTRTRGDLEICECFRCDSPAHYHRKCPIPDTNRGYCSQR